MSSLSSFKNSSCLQDSILFLKAHWLGTWTTVWTPNVKEDPAWNIMEKPVQFNQSNLGTLKKQLLILFGAFNREPPPNTTHQYNGCCCVAAISLWEFRKPLASGFSVEVGHLSRDLLILKSRKSQKHWDCGQNRHEVTLTWTLAPLPFSQVSKPFPGHQCHQQSVSVSYWTQSCSHVLLVETGFG